MKTLKLTNNFKNLINRSLNNPRAFEINVFHGFIISKTQATPSWGLICIGISMNLFALLYWIVDIKNHTRWTFFFKPAGENSLTAYLLPEILYSLILTTGIPVLFYKESGEPLIVIAGSLIWTILIIRLTALLVRFNLKLKI